MNEKTAKLLRKVAGYRNQTATPGVMDFPGIARVVKAPVFIGGVQKFDDEGAPAYEMIPFSKPGKLRAAEPKGVYRAMKKLVARGVDLQVASRYAQEVV